MHRRADERVAITTFVVLLPSYRLTVPVVVDDTPPPVRGPAQLATLDVPEPLRAEAERMVDDARQLARRFRIPALLGAVSDAPGTASPAPSPPGPAAPSPRAG